MIIQKIQVTTHDVVALPTASAPPRAPNPLKTAINEISQAKVITLSRDCQIIVVVTAPPQLA